MPVMASSPSTPNTTYSMGLPFWLVSVWGTPVLTTTRSLMATGNTSCCTWNLPFPPVMKNSSAQAWVWRVEFHSVLYLAWVTYRSRTRLLSMVLSGRPDSTYWLVLKQPLLRKIPKVFLQPFLSAL